MLCFVQKLLILGWGDDVLMVDLLSELDHGPSALPKGSQVTMFNTRTQKEVLGKTTFCCKDHCRVCVQSVNDWLLCTAYVTGHG